MPADRRKKTKTPEAVPDAGDPDRKRVLNVLAQRRYRQKRKEKIAALEAQASELSLQQSSNPSDDGGVRIEPDHTSSSSSGYSPDNFDLIEDIIRQPEVDAFPDLNFGQDQVDLQLFPGLGKCINQLCRLEILCTCMIANLLQKAARARASSDQLRRLWGHNSYMVQTYAPYPLPSRHHQYRRPATRRNRTRAPFH
jgi:hypothetical protein